jgi:hypothetical protein
MKRVRGTVKINQYKVFSRLSENKKKLRTFLALRAVVVTVFLGEARFCYNFFVYAPLYVLNCMEICRLLAG